MSLFINAEFSTERRVKVRAVERVESLQARQQENEAEKERLHQLLKHVQANLEHYQEATQQLRLEQEMIVEKQRATYEQRLLQLHQQIEVMIREKVFLEARCAGLESNYNASLAREAALAEKVEQMHQKYTTLEVNYDRIQHDLSTVSHELSAQRQGFEAKSGELIEYQLRLRMAEGNLDSLRKALSAAEDKIIALRDDYMFMAQEKANLEGQVKMLQTTLEVRA